MVAGLSVKEVANTVRKRRHDSILSLVVEKPRKWHIERLYDLHEKHSEDKMQRFIFGGSYPRTLHLTVIGAIGLPTLRFGGSLGGGGVGKERYPDSFVEVTNLSTAFRCRSRVVTSSAFPAWEELFEITVKAPEDQIVVQLLCDQTHNDNDDENEQQQQQEQEHSASSSGSGSSSSSKRMESGGGNGVRKLSQKLRVPHYDKRFCCDREVTLALTPCGVDGGSRGGGGSDAVVAQLHAMEEAAAGRAGISKKPLVLRLKVSDALLLLFPLIILFFLFYYSLLLSLSLSLFC